MYAHAVLSFYNDHGTTIHGEPRVAQLLQMNCDRLTNAGLFC